MKFPEFNVRSFSVIGLAVASLIIIPVLLITKEHNKEQQVIVVDTVAIQALKVCPPCNEKTEETKKPIPSYTKFKASDWVCAWGKWRGVVVLVEWSDDNPNLLIYKVQHLAVDETWTYDWYYDTELTLGECD